MGGQKIISKQEIEKLKTEIEQELDCVQKEIIRLKDKMNQFKGGIIACDLLLQKKEKPKPKK